MDFQTWDTESDFVWRTNCLHLDLVNVSVTLLSGNSMFSDDSLASVNFIKSHLSVESFSDKSQDVDLISQEILITDTRFRSKILLLILLLYYYFYLCLSILESTIFSF